MAASVLSAKRTMCAEACLVLSSCLGCESKLALVLSLAVMHLAATWVSHLHRQAAVSVHSCIQHALMQLRAVPGPPASTAHAQTGLTRMST
jgi:hypothetical protein